MEQILSAVGVILLGGAGWIALEFVGRPIRQFFDLRKEIRRQIIFLGNLGPLDLPPIEITPEAIEEHVQTLFKAATTLRDLGAQAIAFDQTEWLAAHLVRIVNLRPMQAGRGLIGLANSLGNETEAEAYRVVVEHSLRFDRMSEYDWKHEADS